MTKVPSELCVQPLRHCDVLWTHALCCCLTDTFNLGTKMVNNEVEIEFSKFRFNTVSKPFKLEIYRGSARYLTKDKKSVYGSVQHRSVIVTNNGVRAVVLAPCCQRWKKGDRIKPRGEKLALCLQLDEGQKEVGRAVQ